METFLAYFSSLEALPGYLCSTSSFFFMAFPIPQQQVIYHSTVRFEETGPKLDLNQGLYSMAHFESEYNRG